VTIENNNLSHLKVVTWQDLYTATFSFNTPFQLLLANQDIFFALEVIRILPKRRIVASGVWQGKSVIAKLFIDARSAKFHMNKDAAGIDILHKNNIPTPPICYQGVSEDRRIHVILLDKIDHAKNLQDYLQTYSFSENRFEILQRVVLELATQHVLGVLQKDLHLNNFLLTDKTIYTLDGAQIEQYPRLLTKKISMLNLTLFFSQLNVGTEIEQEHLFRFYAKSRGWLLKNNDIAELFFMIKKWGKHRWQQFEKKITRACSSFVHIKQWPFKGMVDRTYYGPEFIAFLKHPDELFNHSDAIVLKAGRSSTVIRTVLDGHDLVIKRYNIKNIWHRMRRLLCKTRAKSSWHMSQKLKFFGISTAKSVAFIEERFLIFRGKSYFVTEYIAGDHLGDFFSQQDTSLEKKLYTITQVITLLKNLAKLNITHGDLKATNILVDYSYHPILIDLDGAITHLSLDSLHTTWKKEMIRFLDNFQNQPLIYNKIKQIWQNER
jgi:tRNA A-37 threonylcarbamoyl transferase component Bud32